MAKIAFLSGTSIMHSPLFDGWAVEEVTTLYGVVKVKRQGDLVLLNRHGFADHKAPHAINYHANIRALCDLGYQDVLSFNSVGSLRPELPPGTLVSCSDYVSLQSEPKTFSEKYVWSGASPGIPNNLMPELLPKLASEFTIHPGKVYVQMRGPRFETRAEIAVIRSWGDVVGMTAAHEADLCTELGLRYNSLALIDNFANGLVNNVLDFDQFKQQVVANRTLVDRLFSRLLAIYG